MNKNIGEHAYSDASLEEVVALYNEALENYAEQARYHAEQAQYHAEQARKLKQRWSNLQYTKDGVAEYLEKKLEQFNGLPEATADSNEFQRPNHPR